MPTKKQQVEDRDTSGNRQHFEGAFQLHLYNATDRPPQAKLEPGYGGAGTVITVTSGTMQTGLGVVQLFSPKGQNPFFFGYRYVDKVTEMDGKVIWQNVAPTQAAYDNPHHHAV